MTSQVSQRLLDWLHQVLQPNYQNAQRTFDDVADLLYSYRNFKVKTDVYVHEDGKSELLLLIHGPISVRSPSSTIQVPLHVWIPQSFPRSPPIIFVVPGQGQFAKPSNYVDTSCRCYHPALAYWSEDIRVSFLRRVIEALQKAFHEEPPVTTSREVNIPSPSTSTPPPLPSKNSLNDKGTQSASSTVLQTNPPSRYRPPDRPPRPQQKDDINDKAALSAPIPFNHNPQITPARSKVLDVLQQVATSHETRISRLKSELESKRSSIEYAIRSADHQIHELKRIRSLALKNTDILSSKMSETSTLIAKLGSNPYDPIDSAVLAQNAVYNQFITLHVKEAALDDTIYGLSKALDQGTLSFDLFQKVWRSKFH